jgi:uncharacterized protein YceH (UPF0502 family)
MVACNQSSNREPVTHFDESTVAEAVEGLREKKLVNIIGRGESRVTKYRHVLYEALGLRPPAVAALCVLLLRGPQTVGEIRTRTNRLYDFGSLEEVETVLGSLMSGEVPLVTRFARQSGQKEARYAHLLSGAPQMPAPADAEPQNDSQIDRIEKLEKAVEDLKRQFEQFRKQFE